ncbi:MAG: transposase [Mycoplasma sp.]
MKSWRKNFQELTTFFEFPPELKKIIYTTNVIENLNQKIRKFTKNKGNFNNEDSLSKIVYISIQNTMRYWTKTVRNWCMIINQLAILFPESKNLQDYIL